MSVVCRETDTDSSENAESVCPVTSQRVAEELENSSTKVAESLAFEFIVLPAIPNTQGAIIVTVRRHRPHTRRRFLNRWTRQITRLARNLKHRKYKHNSRIASSSHRKWEESVPRSKPRNSSYRSLSPEKRNERGKHIIASLSWHAGIDSREKKPVGEKVQPKLRGDWQSDFTSVKKTCSAIVISTAPRRLSQNFGIGANLGAGIKKNIDLCKADTDLYYSSGDSAADSCVRCLKGANTAESNPPFLANASLSTFTPWYLMQGDDCVRLNSINSKLSSNIASLVVTYDMEDTQKKMVGEAGDSKQRKDQATLYDPIYDFACEFAESHGYGFVVFVDDDPKPQSKRVRRKRLSSKTLISGTFLPHVPVEKDRRWPVHVVKYTSHTCEMHRKKCQVRPAEVRDCVLNHMNLTQSTKKDGDMKKILRKDRVKVDVKVQGPERSASVSSKKPQKRRSSSRGSQFPGQPGVSPTRPCSSSATKLCMARLSSDVEIDGKLGSNKKLGSPDSKHTPESLAAYRERLKQCSKMYEEQLMNNGGSVHSDIDTRKSAEGDATVMEINDQVKMAEEVKATASKLRPANHKLKSKQKDPLTNYYSVDASEENLSRNHAPEDENLNTVEDGGELPVNVTSSLPRLCDKTSKQYKLYNSISATIFRESQLAQRNFGESENSENLPLAKIDFVRVKDDTVKKKSSGIHVSQELYHAVRHHFQNIPRKMKPLYGALPWQSLGRVRCSQHLTSVSVQPHAVAINSEIFRHTRDGEKSESCPNLSLRQMHCDRGLQEHQRKQSPIKEDGSLLAIGDAQAGTEARNVTINETLTPAWGDCINVDFNDSIENSVVKKSEKDRAEKVFDGDHGSPLFESSASHINGKAPISISRNVHSMECNSDETSPMKGISPQNLSSPADLMTYLESQTGVNNNQRREEEPEDAGECSYSYEPRFEDVRRQYDNVNNNALPDKSSQSDMHLKDDQVAPEGACNPPIRTLTTSPLSAGQGEDPQPPKHVNFISGKNMEEYLRLPVLPQRSKSTTNNGHKMKLTCDNRDVVGQIPPVPRSSCITKSPSPMRTKSTIKKEHGDMDFGQSSMFPAEHSGSAESWMSGIIGKHNKRRPPRLSPVPCKSIQHPLGNINAQGDNVLKEKRLFVSVPKLDAYNQVKFKNNSSLVSIPRNPEGGDELMQFTTPTKNDHQETNEPAHSDFVFLLPIEEHKSLITVKQCTGKRGADEKSAGFHSSKYASKQKDSSKSPHFSTGRSGSGEKIANNSQEVKDDSLFPSLNFSNTNESENNNNNALDSDNSTNQDSNSHSKGGSHPQLSFAASLRKSRSYVVLRAENCSENQNSNASSSKTDTSSNTYSSSSNRSNVLASSTSSADSVSEESFEQALDRELQMLLESQSCCRPPRDTSAPICASRVPNLNTSNVTKKPECCNCSENSGRGIHESRSTSKARIRNRCTRNSGENIATATNEDQVTAPSDNAHATEENGPMQNVPAISESVVEHAIPPTTTLNEERSAFCQHPTNTFAPIDQPYRDPQRNDHTVAFLDTRVRCQTAASRDSVPYCPTTENYWDTAGRESFIKMYVPETSRQSSNDVKNYDPLTNVRVDRQLSSTVKNWRTPSAFMENVNRLSPEAPHSSRHKISSNVTLPQNNESVSELNKTLDSRQLRSQSNFTKRLEEVARTAQESLQSLQRLVESKFNLFRTRSYKTVESDKDESADEPDAIQLNTQKARSRGVNMELPLNVSKYNRDKKRQLTDTPRDDEGDAGDETLNQDVSSMSGMSDTTFPTIQFNEVKTSTYDPSGLESTSFGQNSAPNTTLSQETVNTHVKKKTVKYSRRSAVTKSNSRRPQKGTRRARRRNKSSRGRRRWRYSTTRYKSVRQSMQETNGPIKKHCCMGRNGNSRYQRAEHSRACRRRQMMEGTCCNLCLPVQQPSSWEDIVNKQNRPQRHRAHRPRKKSRSSRQASGRSRVRTRKKRRDKLVRFYVSPHASRRKHRTLRSPELQNCSRRTCRKHCSACMHIMNNHLALSHSSRNSSENNLSEDAPVDSVSGSARLNMPSSRKCHQINSPSKRMRKETRYVITPKGQRALYQIMQRRNDRLLGNVLRISEDRANQRSVSQIEEIVRRFRRLISQFPDNRLRALDELIISKERMGRSSQTRLLAISGQSPARSRRVLRQTPDDSANAVTTRGVAGVRQLLLEPYQPHASTADPSLACDGDPSWGDESLGDGPSGLDQVPVDNVFRRPGLYFFNTTAGQDDESLEDLASAGEATPPRRTVRPGPVDSLSLIRKNLSKNKNTSRNASKRGAPKQRDFNFMDFANRAGHKCYCFNSSGNLSDEERGGYLEDGSSRSASLLGLDPRQVQPAVHLNPPFQFGFDENARQNFLENMQFFEQYQSRQNAFLSSFVLSEGYRIVPPGAAGNYSVTPDIAYFQNDLSFMMETDVFGESSEVNTSGENSLINSVLDTFFRTDRCIVGERNREPSETLNQAKHDENASRAPMLNREPSETLNQAKHDENASRAPMLNREPSETLSQAKHDENVSRATVLNREPSETLNLAKLDENASRATMLNREPSETLNLAKLDENASRAPMLNREPSETLNLAKLDENAHRAQKLKAENLCSSSYTSIISSNAQESSVRSLPGISEYFTNVNEGKSSDKGRAEDKASPAAREAESGSQNNSHREASGNGGKGQLGRVIKRPQFTSSLWKGFERAKEADLPSDKHVMKEPGTSNNGTGSCFKVPGVRPLIKKRKSSLPVSPPGFDDSMRLCSHSTNPTAADLKAASSSGLAVRDDAREKHFGGEESNKINSDGEESSKSSAACTTRQEMTPNLPEGLGETRLPHNEDMSALSVYRASPNKCFTLEPSSNSDNGAGKHSIENATNAMPTSALPDPMIDLAPEHISKIIDTDRPLSQHSRESHTNVLIDMFCPESHQTRTCGTESEEKTTPLVISPKIIVAPEETKENPDDLASPTTAGEVRRGSMAEEQAGKLQPQQDDLMGNHITKGSIVEGGLRQFRDVRCHKENNLISYDKIVCNQRDTGSATSFQCETQHTLIVHTPGISTTWHCIVPQNSEPPTHQRNDESETRNTQQCGGTRSHNVPQAHCSKDERFGTCDKISTSPGRHENGNYLTTKPTRGNSNSEGSKDGNLGSSTSPDEVVHFNPTVQPEEMPLADTGNAPNANGIHQFIKRTSGVNPCNDNSCPPGPRMATIQSRGYERQDGIHADNNFEHTNSSA
ncbi:unnamed protein product, partial [Lymnaea stagnalis]